MLLFGLTKSEKKVTKSLKSQKNAVKMTLLSWTKKSQKNYKNAVKMTLFGWTKKSQKSDKTAVKMTTFWLELEKVQKRG